MTKILFRGTAGNRKPGDKIYLRGYKKPFKVIMIQGDGTVRVQHTTTKQLMWLSPGWHIEFEDNEMYHINQILCE
jgi:hypothetical protein